MCVRVRVYVRECFKLKQSEKLFPDVRMLAVHVNWDNVVFSRNRCTQTCVHCTVQVIADTHTHKGDSLEVAL